MLYLKVERGRREMSERDYKQRRVHTFDGETCREIQMSEGIVMSEGGWYYGKTWITGPELKTAERRWVERLYATSPTDDHNWIEHQCGGCRFFGALDGDWGLCVNAASPNDGRLTFEHTGCEAHSYFEESLGGRKDG